eukprot:2639369-Heterocapsa_arctica.AAC.1
MACMKVRVQGDIVAIWTAYAPHELKLPDERQLFYTELGHQLERSSAHGATLVCGDFDARIHVQRPGEQDIFRA